MNSEKCLTSDEDVCPQCKNTGWIYYTDSNGYEMGKICPCGIRERQILADRLKFADLPKSLAGIRLRDLKDVRFYNLEESRKTIINTAKVIKAWLERIDNMLKRGQGLYFYSNTKGSGKTSFAAAIANELMHEKHIACKFATSTQIVQEIKGTWGKKDDSESELLKDLARIPVLIIDDFGTESVKDWISERFYSVMNDRYLNNKPTIITSNYSMDHLPYDERIINRIKERCYELPFPEE